MRKEIVNQTKVTLLLGNKFLAKTKNEDLGLLSKYLPRNEHETEKSDKSCDEKML
jgi:hypothetical protein